MRARGSYPERLPRPAVLAQVSPAAALPGTRPQPDVNVGEQVLVRRVLVVVETEVHSPALRADVARRVMVHRYVMYKLRPEIKIAKEIVVSLEVQAVVPGRAAFLFRLPRRLENDALDRAEMAAGKKPLSLLTTRKSRTQQSAVLSMATAL